MLLADKHDLLHRCVKPAKQETETDQPVSSYSTAALSKRLPTYDQPKYIRTTAAATTASAPKVPLIIHSAGCINRDALSE